MDYLITLVVKQLIIVLNVMQEIIAKDVRAIIIYYPLVEMFAKEILIKANIILTMI